jgi:putative flippase GtrA
MKKSFIKQLILYGIFGGFGAVTDIAFFYLLSQGGVISPTISNVISVHLGIIVSFVLNRNYNFKIKDNTINRFLKFYVTGLFGLLVSTGLIIVGEYLDYDTMLVKLVSVFLVAGCQFVINRFITFNEKEVERSRK